MTTTISIAGREVGNDLPVYVIAEGGVNHNGSVDLAVQLTHAAAEAGACAVKWQVRKPELHADPSKPLRYSCAFPPDVLVTELQHRGAMEFTAEGYARVSSEAEAVGLDCFASAWDEPSVEFLAAFHPPAWKVASATVTDLPTLDAIRWAARRDGSAIIMSTGMSTIEQIDRAVDTLGREQLALMHCVSTYPCRVEDCNLRVIPYLLDRYGVPVGWSGHETAAVSVTLRALRWGASFVERHLTLDRSMRGSDHAASLEPQGFALMVREIRAGESADGDGVKRVTEGEALQAARLRRRT